MKVNNDEKKELTLNEKIEGWKKEHGKIYQSVIGDKSYIWRRIKRSEYSAIMSMELENSATLEDRIYSRQDAIVRLVVLNIPIEELNQDLEDLSGLSTCIADEVLDKSGFNVKSTIEL